MANNRQKDYNGLESTTYLHLQLHLNIKAQILRICSICGIIYFTVNVLTVSKGKEWNGWHKALICWNTQLSSSKNIFQKLLCILVTFRFEVIKILVLKLRRISVHLFNLRLQLDSQLDYRWVKRVDPLSPVRFNLNGGNLHFL